MGTQGPQERNYHIFYFMFKGLSDDEMGLCSLAGVKPEEFWYLKQGGCTEVPGIDDKAGFEELMESLELFRFGKSDLKAIWQLTAGILHCGNIHFTEDDGGRALCNPDSSSSI